MSRPHVAGFFSSPEILGVLLGRRSHLGLMFPRAANTLNYSRAGLSLSHELAATQGRLLE
jgi:hypothetical protein